jgi:hypothetical protein
VKFKINLKKVSWHIAPVSADIHHACYKRIYLTDYLWMRDLNGTASKLINM